MNFKFPSLAALAGGARKTLIRFPFTLLSAVLGSACMMYFITLKYDIEKENEYLIKLTMCSALSLSFTLALAIFSERRRHSIMLSYALQILALLLVGAYYYWLPEPRDMNYSEGARYALFILGLHLLVAFAPFIGRGETNGFWQFNKTLFLRFLLSGLYSGVLFAGLALAMVAVDQLFGVDFKDYRYGQLWFFLAGIFNTWFFLSGVPEQWEELEGQQDYPKGLKIFTQYVLLPLVTVYLVILYAYGFKILFEWSLPKGWVSWLVNAFSVFGILSLLLIWPIRNEEGNKWINWFSRWFYRAIFPLIILLGVAIGKRVLQYGITENRYFVLVVALWLLGIALYFLVSKAKNIKAIPVTLCLVAFLSSFGPWGAFSVSERSQVNRLEGILIQENMLVNGKVQPPQDTISAKGARQISSIVRYLGDHHDLRVLQPWFDADLDTLLAPDSPGERVYGASKVLDLMGVEDEADYYYDEESDTATTRRRSFYYYAYDYNRNAIQVQGYDYMVRVNKYLMRDTVRPDSDDAVRLGTDSLRIRSSASGDTLVLTGRNGVWMKAGMKEFIMGLRTYNKEHKKYPGDDQMPDEKMVFMAENDSLRLKLVLENISGTFSADSVWIDNLNGVMLLGRRKQ